MSFIFILELRNMRQKKGSSHGGTSCRHQKLIGIEIFVHVIFQTYLKGICLQLHICICKIHSFLLGKSPLNTDMPLHAN